MASGRSCRGRRQPQRGRGRVVEGAEVGGAERGRELVVGVAVEAEEGRAGRGVHAGRV